MVVTVKHQATSSSQTKMLNKLMEIKELLVFFKNHQIYLIPFILFLVIFGLLIIVSNMSPIPLFIYPLI